MKMKLLLGVLIMSAPVVSARELLEIKITSGIRFEQSIKDTLAAASVITRKDIERLQLNDLREALRTVPGLGVGNNGGVGKATSVFLRGTESDHVLVLINGVRAGSATLGTFPFQDMPLSQIERVEVIRGPRASLYGSEAIGGVIQIFTKKGGGEPAPEFRVTSGRYGTGEWTAGLSGGGEKSWFNVSLSDGGTSGFNACTGSATAGCFTVEPDRDGNSNSSYSVRGGYRFAGGAEIDLFGLRSSTDTDFDGTVFGGNDSQSIERVHGVSLRMPMTGKWDINLSAGQNLSAIDSFFNGAFVSRFNTTREILSFQNNIRLGDERLFSVGVDKRNGRIDSTTAYAETSRDNTGVFAQYVGKHGAHQFEASLRNDDNEHSGSHVTGGLAWGYRMRDTRVTISCGSAFKVPTFNELYFPFFGNADLQEEISETCEAGLLADTGRIAWSANLFATNINDLIISDTDNNFLAGNVSKAKITGAELTATATVKQWDIRANATFMSARDRSSGANNGNVLARRAEQIVNIDVDRRLGKWRVGGGLHAQGGRYDDSANTRKLDGYETVDLRAEYGIDSDWTVAARIDNLFDKSYETASFYNQPGQAVYVTVRWQPDLGSRLTDAHGKPHYKSLYAHRR